MMASRGRRSAFRDRVSAAQLLAGGEAAAHMLRLLNAFLMCRRYTLPRRSISSLTDRCRSTAWRSRAARIGHRCTGCCACWPQRERSGRSRTGAFPSLRSARLCEAASQTPFAIGPSTWAPQRRGRLGPPAASLASCWRTACHLRLPSPASWARGHVHRWMTHSQSGLRPPVSSATTSAAGAIVKAQESPGGKA